MEDKEELIDAKIGLEPILRFFKYRNLSPVPLSAEGVSLWDIGEAFAGLALGIMDLSRSPERTVALRKLLESKEAVIRAAS